MEKNHMGNLGGLPVFFAPLLNISAGFIVFGGTISAAMVSFPLPILMRLPSLFIKSMSGAAEGGPELVALFLRLAEKARRQGLLSLEDEAAQIEDEFLKKGIMLVVDGTDPEVVRTVLEIDSAVLRERHKSGYELLEAMGGYSPTMGIIGTVMGLVSVLSDLSDISRLGPAIAVAFIATLYGVGTANILWLPLASKLKRKSEAEVAGREMMLEGILSIQAGDNPRIVQEKLAGYLAPSIRPREEGARQEAGAGRR
ncbi:MAG: motility protein A [Chloroflexi bacterium]|nr:motility protein A [Chloroflexota bacterium]